MDVPNGMIAVLCAYTTLRQTAQISCVDAGFRSFDWWKVLGSRR
jgi:hypothetical protein